jgi:hypothetical protein
MSCWLPIRRGSTVTTCEGVVDVGVFRVIDFDDPTTKPAVSAFCRMSGGLPQS